jgi:hypothetical protein
MVRIILSSVLIYTILCIGQLNALACNDSKEKLLYMTKFTTEEPPWVFSETIRATSEGLAIEPPSFTIHQNIYQGDFFDVAIVCTSIVLVRRTNADDSAGVLFWAKDYDHNYLFEISPRAGTFFVGRRIGNQLAFPIIAKQSDAVKKGEKDLNELAAMLNGDTADLYINGTKVGSVQAQSWTEGNKVGVIAETSDKEKAMWQFTEFQISRLAK